MCFPAAFLVPSEGPGGSLPQSWNMATSFVNSDPFEPQLTMAKDYQDLQSLDVVDENQRHLGRVLPSPQSSWRRICPTSRLLLVLTAFCGILTLSVVIIGIKRTQLSTDQQGTWETLKSVNLTLSTSLGRHQRKVNDTSLKLATLEKLLSVQSDDMRRVETRLKNLLGSLEKDSKAFRCQLVEMKSNGSKTGCCPKNWELFHNSCYWTTRQRLPWEAAKQDCERKSAHLVILNSPDEKAFVVQHKRSSDMWIGLTDASGSWKWVDGSSYVLHPEDWAEGQPDHWYGHGLGGGEDCVQISSSDGWNDNHCSRPFTWMCEVELEA